jgi:hypothetical protein
MNNNNNKTQNITAANTSLNHIPRGMKMIAWKAGEKNLDFGGGRYNTTTEFVRDNYKVENYVYDPFNRTIEENSRALSAKVSTITCFNVLNVLETEELLVGVLCHIKQLMEDNNAIAYFTVYEGDKSGRGKATSKGYQRNSRLKTYMSYFELVYPGYNIEVKDRLVTIKNPPF